MGILWLQLNNILVLFYKRRNAITQCIRQRVALPSSPLLHVRMGKLGTGHPTNCVACRPVLS